MKSHDIGQRGLFDSLADAQDRLMRGLGKGIHCPCCGKWNHTDRRSLNATMAWGLCWIEAFGKGQWVDVPKHAPHRITNTNQHTTLKWWKLLERLPSDIPSRKHSGIWRTTQLGRSFVHREILVPTKVITWKNEVVRTEGPMIDIVAALASGGFDYREVMEEVWL